MNDSRGDNCKDMRELLSAYRDAELDANERPLVEAHLNNCSDCRDELAAVESVVKSLKSLPAATLSRDFSADIESLISRSEADSAKPVQTTEKVVSISKKKPMLWIAAAAAVVMLMVVSYHGTTGGGNEPVVATGGAATQVKTAEKDVLPEAVTQEKPLVADSDVNPTESDANPNSSVDSPKAINQHESIANKPVSNTAEREETHLKAASSPAIATIKKTTPNQTGVVYVDDLSDNQALVAFSEPNDDSDYDDFGISTDEDGLYAIKM